MDPSTLISTPSSISRNALLRASVAGAFASALAMTFCCFKPSSHRRKGARLYSMRQGLCLHRRVLAVYRRRKTNAAKQHFRARNSFASYRNKRSDVRPTLGIGVHERHELTPPTLSVKTTQRTARFDTSGRRGARVTSLRCSCCSRACRYLHRARRSC